MSRMFPPALLLAATALLVSCSSFLAPVPEQTATSADPNARPFPQTPVPPEMFGMHLLRVGARETRWPDVPVGIYRLVDATPRWHHLSTGPDAWWDDLRSGAGLARLEAVLHFRDRYGGGTPVIYTLAGGGDDRIHGQWRGGFPQWFTAKTDTMAEWRRHVRKLGHRFRGRVQYWEIWNEPDCVCFYTGSVAQLVEFTRVAAEELRRIDPANRIVGPAFTDQGLVMMNAFYAAGGGAHVDIVAWHQTNHSTPELDTTRIKRARAIMQRHGLGDLPLWTTEGHAIANPAAGDAAIVARTWLTLWLYGVSSFSWYAWDIPAYATVPGHEKTNWITFMDEAGATKPGALAYGELSRWVVGSRVISFHVERDVWVVQTDRGWIVWAAGPRVKPWRVPGGMTRLRRLDGTSSPVAGPMYVPTAEPVFYTQ